MCTPSKGFLWEIANNLMKVVPGRIGELFPLAFTPKGGIYLPPRLRGAGPREIENAFLATVAGLAQRYPLSEVFREKIEILFSGHTHPDDVVKLILDLCRELVCHEGMAGALESVDFTETESHFLMLRAVVRLFCASLAKNQRALNKFLPDLWLSIMASVREATAHAVESLLTVSQNRLDSHRTEMAVSDIVRTIIARIAPNLDPKMQAEMLSTAQQIAREKIASAYGHRDQRWPTVAWNIGGKIVH